MLLVVMLQDDLCDGRTRLRRHAWRTQPGLNAVGVTEKLPNTLVMNALRQGLRILEVRTQSMRIACVHDGEQSGRHAFRLGHACALIVLPQPAPEQSTGTKHMSGPIGAAAQHGIENTITPCPFQRWSGPTS